MSPTEFRRVLFKTDAQWAHGVGFRLEPIAGGGVALFSRHAFSQWVSQADPARGATALTIAGCGRVYWTHRHDCGLYRFDPGGELVERVIDLKDCGDHRGCRFGRLLNAGGRLWILDRSRARAFALRPDTLQIIGEIALFDPVDLAAAGGLLYALDPDGIRVYSSAGQPLSDARPIDLASPVTFAASPQRRVLYVVDARSRAFLRFSVDGRSQGELGNLDDAGPTFEPRLLAVHPQGNLFVSDGGPIVHEFAADGGYIGSTGNLASVPAISDMTFDAAGRLYLATPAGIARLDRSAALAGNAGAFYSGTLDNGADESGTWHRADVVAELSGGGTLDVFYATSNDRSLAGHVAAILASGSSPADRVAALEKMLADEWRGPVSLRAIEPAAADDAVPDASRRPTHSLLFPADTGRYLWIKLVLSGLVPQSSASIRELRVIYPRLSYLRYLPAVYQQDPASREFLERYLSLFETVLSGLEDEGARLTDLFDPDRTPSGFLDWLAQWLDLGFEEDWRAEVKRDLIRRAAALYASKGTPAGLAAMIQLVTDRPAIIRESFEAERASILGDAAGLGTATYLRRPPAVEPSASEHLQLGEASYLGQSPLRADPARVRNPFSAAAHQFTVALDLSPQQFQHYSRSVHRIIRDHSPAHADYDIRLVAGAGLGPDAVVGVNLRVEDPQPLHLGHSQLGRSVCVRAIQYGPELDIDAVVIGGSQAGEGACAHPCGER